MTKTERLTNSGYCVVNSDFSSFSHSFFGYQYYVLLLIWSFAVILFPKDKTQTMERKIVDFLQNEKLLEPIKSLR